MSSVLHRTSAVSLIVLALSGCLGIGSDDAGPLDPEAMDAALNALGDEVTDGDVRAVFPENCPLLGGDDLIDALLDADALDRSDVDDADAEVASTVRGPWGSYSMVCQHPTFSLTVRNGGPDDRNELIDVVESDPDTDRDVEPFDIDGLDASSTYEIRQDGEPAGVGWIDDETAVEVVVRSGAESADEDRSATALVTVLGLLDEEYGDTEPVERPDEPPIDLADVRVRVRDLGDDVADLTNGERLDDCPSDSRGDVGDLIDEIGLDASDVVKRDAFIVGATGTPNVSIQCSFTAGDATVSITVALVEFDGLDELDTVLTRGVGDAIDRTIDVDAQTDRLPDDAVFSVRDGDDVVGAGVLSDEVLIQVTVARGDVDEGDLLAALPTVVDLVTGSLG